MRRNKKRETSERERERERERDVSNGICKVVLRNLSFQNMEKVNLT